MKKEKSGKQDGDNKNPYTTLSLFRHHLTSIDLFVKNNHTTRDEFFDDLNSLLVEPNMSFSVLKERYDNMQMMQSIQQTLYEHISSTRKHENDVSKILETLIANNLKFSEDTTTKILEVKTKENVVNEQHFELSKAFISTVITDEEKVNTIFETAKHAYNESKKAQEAEKAAELAKAKLKTNTKEDLTLVGLVSNAPKIGATLNSKDLYCQFSLIENKGTSQEKFWKHVVLWEGSLTENLGLTTKESINAYFLKIKQGDLLKLTGIIYDGVMTRKDGSKFTAATFGVTEILEHISASPIEKSK
ncbi:MAG: hypothetical protein ACYDCN_11780 [Bacteroidia bacterium]